MLWRIALAERSGSYHDALLDSYTHERRTIASAMVDNTTKATRLMTIVNPFVSAVRSFGARQALKLESVRNKMGRAIGMLDLICDKSPIVVPGHSARIAPGRRLPNPTSGDIWLHDLLDDRRHTILVLQQDESPILTDLRAAGLFALHVSNQPDVGDFFDPEGALQEALGGAKLVIVRPDRIIAMATKEVDPASVYQYARDVLGVSPQSL